eukprot:s954_g18.t1
MVNFAVTQNEGVSIHTIDHIAAMIALWMGSTTKPEVLSLKAKCWDLSDAYKQVPLSDQAFDLDSFLAVFDPSNSEAQIFQQKVLPFGSVASVTAFLRVSLAIWKIGTSLLKLMWSSYFDDFLCLSREAETKHVDFCVDAIFSILGWKISTHKLLPFDSLCKVLGVQLDLRESGDRMCFLSNTSERVEELTSEIDTIIQSGVLRRHEGERLRGQLQFAGSQIFGRRFRRLLKLVSNHVTSGRKLISDLTKECLLEIRDSLKTNVPRKVCATLNEVYRIYVDASFDPDKFCGVGGVLLDSYGKPVAFFSEEVDQNTLMAIMTLGQRTVIQELEMLAAVRGSFLKSWSNNKDSDEILNVIFDVETSFSIPIWIERVPSQSNPADIMSREELTEYFGADRAAVDLWEVWCLVADVTDGARKVEQPKSGEKRSCTVKKSELLRVVACH